MTPTLGAEFPRSRVLVKIIVRGALGLGCMDGMLFGLAGRTDWPAAWILTLMFAGMFSIGGAWFLRQDPELLEERMSTAANVPRWDRILVRGYWLLLLALFFTSALDAGRFQWSHVPPALQAVGGAAVLAAFALIWWCTTVNHFLSSHVRIQTERGHIVVQDGPYRYVRHPMYTAFIVLMFGIALVLGSWLALVPAGLIGMLFVIRTLLEDRLLNASLAGYREYANRVPLRLVPGVW